MNPSRSDIVEETEFTSPVVILVNRCAGLSRALCIELLDPEAIETWGDSSMAPADAGNKRRHARPATTYARFDIDITLPEKGTAVRPSCPPPERSGAPGLGFP